MASPILHFFTFEHLPDNPATKVRTLIGTLARTLDGMLPEGAEKSTALRKLLEAQDCAVRSYFPTEAAPESPTTTADAKSDTPTPAKRGRPAKPKPDPAPEPEKADDTDMSLEDEPAPAPAKKGSTDKTPEEVAQDLKAAISALAGKDKAKAVAILKSVNAAKFSEIPPGKHAAVLAQFRAALDGDGDLDG